MLSEETTVPEGTSKPTVVDKTTPTLTSSPTPHNDSNAPSNSSPTHQDVAGEAQEENNYDNRTEQPLTNGPIKSEDSDINDEMLHQSTTSCDTDGGSHDLDTSSCDQKDSDSMIVEDVESTISQSSSAGGGDNLQYDFVASYFIIKVRCV